MDATYVTSSNIDCAAHEDGNLIIRFKKGVVYLYANVDYAVFDALVKAESAGKFFTQFIRPKYLYTALDFDPFTKEPITA